MRVRSLCPLLLALALALSGALVGGCEDVSRMFAGRWGSTNVLQSEWLSGRPELAVGHYGPEVTGVVYFANAAGVVVGPCRCAFLDHQSVDLAAERFRATTELDCDGSVWLWDLAVEVDDNDDLFLVGTVETTDGTSRSLPLRLELIDRFVPEDRKACE